MKSISIFQLLIRRKEKMIKTIGLFLIAAVITWLATPATLAIYLNGTGFGMSSGRPLLLALIVPLAVLVGGVWIIAIKQYRKFSKENYSG
jgi:hypothetical protein